MAQQWEVVGGAGKGGIVVRERRELASSPAASRLSTGARVEELALQGDRLHYRLLQGAGPSEGWVSVRASGKELAVRLSEVLADPVDPRLGGLRLSPEKPEALSPALAELFGLAGAAGEVEQIDVPEGSRLRVATISDIHIDHKQNLGWFDRHLPKKGEQDCYNVLVLPGDVSDDPGRLRAAFEMFTGSFDLVCYTPGNHDIWVSRQNSPPDSLAKLREVLELCKECGVRTRPVKLRPGCPAQRALLLVPLLSFYASAWDREPDMPWLPKEQRDMVSWMDFRAIKWPQELVEEVRRREGDFAFGAGKVSTSISEIFGSANELWLERLLPEVGGTASDRECTVISYSHYLPRQELFPEKRFLLDGNLHKVAGSSALDAQISRLRPDVHVFGHTHLTVDVELEGQRYVQWALGTPQEQRAMTRAVGDTGMLVLYDSGGADPHVVPVQTTFWGRYFAKGLRKPSETCPPPFIRGLYASRFPEVKMPFDDEHFAGTPNPGPPIECYDGLFEPRWRM